MTVLRPYHCSWSRVVRNWEIGWAIRATVESGGEWDILALGVTVGGG
jgi:hypothetical protein